MRVRSASAAAAASASRASCSWAMSSSVRSWLSRPRRRNWPITVSSTYNSTAPRAFSAAWGAALIMMAGASAAVIAPDVTAAGTGGSLTAANHMPRLGASTTNPCGCKTASATPEPPIKMLAAACAAWPRRAQRTLIAVATAAAYTASAMVTPRPAPCRPGAG